VLILPIMPEVKKIVIIGGESTGKSTLCAQLAAHYNTSWVREFAREFLEKQQCTYAYSDLVKIALGQLASENIAVNKANQYLFCDTNLHVIKVWSEHKYKQCDPIIIEQIKQQKYDAYILTSPDFPWQHDPLREHPEEAMRQYFFMLYKSILENEQTPFCIVDGSERNRLIQAIAFIEELF
jgi:NadR type nicotinamide-nucleotide adenylyltransferase